MGSVTMIAEMRALKVGPMLELLLIQALIIDGGVMDSMEVATQALANLENPSMGNVTMLVKIHVVQAEPMLELLLIPVLIIDGDVMDSMVVATQALVKLENPSMGSVTMLVEMHVAQAEPMLGL